MLFSWFNITVRARKCCCFGSYPVGLSNLYDFLWVCLDKMWLPAFIYSCDYLSVVVFLSSFMIWSCFWICWCFGGEWECGVSILSDVVGKLVWLAGEWAWNSGSGFFFKKKMVLLGGGLMTNCTCFWVFSSCWCIALVSLGTVLWFLSVIAMLLAPLSGFVEKFGLFCSWKMSLEVVLLFCSITNFQCFWVLILLCGVLFFWYCWEVVIFG